MAIAPGSAGTGKCYRMGVKLKKINCGHRRAGRGETAIEVVFVTPDGKRRPVGQICRQCAMAFGPQGLGHLAILYTDQALAWQPKLGDVQIAFTGIERVFSSDQRQTLLATLETGTTIEAEQVQRGLEQAGYRSFPSEELARRVTFKV